MEPFFVGETSMQCRGFATILTAATLAAEMLESRDAAPAAGAEATSSANEKADK